MSLFYHYLSPSLKIGVSGVSGTDINRHQVASTSNYHVPGVVVTLTSAGNDKYYHHNKICLILWPLCLVLLGVNIGQNM